MIGRRCHISVPLPLVKAEASHTLQKGILRCAQKDKIGSPPENRAAQVIQFIRLTKIINHESHE